MPVRNMLYDAMQYNQQVTEIAEKHKGKKAARDSRRSAPESFCLDFIRIIN